ncbi:MAG: hypothetical protein OXR62_11070 [Ahrensia sp.]|nr:hypothetical protein [Ahrensia sp.]
MAAINKLELWQAASKLGQKICDLGALHLRYGTDHRDLEVIADRMGKGVLGEHFRRSLHTLSPHRFMWVAAVDDDGDVVGIAAARLDDITGWSLQRYIKEHFERCFRTAEGEPVRLLEESASFAEQITGPCAYLGEGFAAHKWRKKGLATLVVQHLMLMVWDEWKPSIMYGWMRKRHAITGMAVSWGFTETYAQVLKFENEPDDPELKDAHFVGCRSAGVAGIIDGLSQD